MRFSVKLCIVFLSLYALLAAFGEVQYRMAIYRDVTPQYNVVNPSGRYLPPTGEPAFADRVEVGGCHDSYRTWPARVDYR